MKGVFVAAVMILFLPIAVLGIDAIEDELSTSDLAAHLGVGHKTFTYEHDGSISAVTYRLLLYKGGKIVSRSGHTDATFYAKQGLQRISVVYKDNGDSVDVTIKKNGGTHHMNVPKPESIGCFNVSSGGVRFDDKNQLILACHIEPENGTVVSTDKNMTAEGADAALVLQIETR